MRTLFRGLAGTTMAFVIGAPLTVGAADPQVPMSEQVLTFTAQQKLDWADTEIANIDAQSIAAVNTKRSAALEASDLATRDCIDGLMPQITNLRGLMATARSALAGFNASSQADLANQEVVKIDVARGQIVDLAAQAMACGTSQQAGGGLTQVEVVEPTDVEQTQTDVGAPPPGPTPLMIGSQPPPS